MYGRKLAWVRKLHIFCSTVNNNGPRVVDCVHNLGSDNGGHDVKRFTKIGEI